MSASIAPTPTGITIGIDISKRRLDGHPHPHGTVKRFDNDDTGITQLINWIRPGQPTRIVFEATGAYHRALEMALGRAAPPGVKVNPLQARRFAEAAGERVKTDPIDAAMLARFGHTMRPDVPPAKDRDIDVIGELVGARRALVKDRTAALNRGKTLTLPLLKRQSQQHLDQAQAQAIDRERATILADNARLKARADTLVSIPGFGAATAAALLSDMPELGSMDGKRTASLAGLAPITRQSGSWRGKSFVQGGRATLRQAIHRPALVAIRFNPPLKAKYQALRATGKPAKGAVVAIMRKLLITANALLRDDRKWTLEMA